MAEKHPSLSRTLLLAAQWWNRRWKQTSLVCWSKCDLALQFHRNRTVRWLFKLFTMRVANIYKWFLFQNGCELSALSCFQKAQLKPAKAEDNGKRINLLIKQLRRKPPSTKLKKPQKHRPVRLSCIISFLLNNLIYDYFIKVYYLINCYITCTLDSHM